MCVCVCVVCVVCVCGVCGVCGCMSSNLTFCIFHCNTITSGPHMLCYSWCMTQTTQLLGCSGLNAANLDKGVVTLSKCILSG